MTVSPLQAEGGGRGVPVAKEVGGRLAKGGGGHGLKVDVDVDALSGEVRGARAALVGAGVGIPQAAGAGNGKEFDLRRPVGPTADHQRRQKAAEDLQGDSDGGQVQAAAPGRKELHGGAHGP
jgi:hypothetical protein